MQIYGDITKLKSAIERKYSGEIAKVEKETNNTIREIKAELQKKLEIKKLRAKTATETEEKKAYSKIMSEEKLKAKKEFEQIREELINKVFEEAENMVKEKAKGKRYIEFVRKFVAKYISGKNAEMVTDSDIYKKHFPKFKTRINKNIVGVRFELNRIVYDLTLDAAIRSKKEQIRQKISKALFEA